MALSTHTELTKTLEDLGLAAIAINSNGDVIAANQLSATLFMGEVSDLLARNWAGLDAQRTMISHKMQWKKLKVASAISYTTDLLTHADLLRPVRVTMVKEDDQMAIIRLEDQLQTEQPRQQLNEVSRISGVSYFSYNFLNDQLELSADLRQMLHIPATIQTAAQLLPWLVENISQARQTALQQLFEELKEGPFTFCEQIHMKGPESSPEITIEGRSFANALHSTHLVGAVRRRDTATETTSAAGGDTFQQLAQFSIDAARDMIFWTRPDGSFVYANEVARRNLGYAWETLSQMRAQDTTVDWTDEAGDIFWANLRQEKQIKAEFELIRKDGSRFAISGYTSYVKIDGEEYACSFTRDLTERMKRDAQIELSKLAMDESRDYIMWLYENQTIRYLNDTMLELMGGKLRDWEGQHFQQLWPELEEKNLDREDIFDLKVKNRQQKSIWVSVSSNRLSLNGQSYYVLTSRNVSKERKNETKLQGAYDEIAVLKEKLEEENTTLRKDIGEKYSIEDIITVSPKYRKVIRQVHQVASVNTTVLITGETGTGKELLARAIHALSDREHAALVKVNCAALPENLIESELFGHEKGAFTGATGQKKGRFELANNGTIFLDEIGELPLELQSKLLRVLQEGEFERLGGTKTLKVDVRLIAATNRDLAKMVRKGTFREDLYYRLNVFPIVNLPLRDRPEDIPILAEYFANKFSRRQGKHIKEINGADLKELEQYSFPGNIRELENIIERAVVLCQSNILRIQLEKQSRGTVRKEDDTFLDFESMQRKHIIKALKRTGGRITGQQGAGRLLGLNDRTLMSKMKKMNIQKREYFN